MFLPVRAFLVLALGLVAVTVGAGTVTQFAARSYAIAGSETADDWLLDSGHYIDAKMSMLAVAPRAGLTTSNIYYVAHPNVPYELPFGVLGGARPLHYEVTEGPSGFTIDAETGIMSWPTPTTTGSPHDVTVRVCDQEHTRPSTSCLDTSWTITVSTSGWIFIDDTGNDSNDGSFGSPKQTTAAIEAASTTTVIVLREGVDLTWDEDLCDDARRIMGFPGESATLDFATEQCDGIGDIATNRAFVNLTIEPRPSAPASGETATCIMDWPSGASDILVYNVTVTNAGGVSASSDNPALFFSGQNDPEWTEYIYFAHNDIQGTGQNSIFLGYSTRYLLAENNTISNSETHGFSAKTRNEYWTIAENTGLTGNDGELFNCSDWEVGGTLTSHSYEIAWNNWASSSRGVLCEQGNGDLSLGTGDTWLYRNTWQIDYHHNLWDPLEVYVENDVVEYTDAAGDPHGWEWEGTADSGTYSGEECVGRGVDIVNASGVLQGSYATACLGTHGHVAQ